MKHTSYILKTFAGLLLSMTIVISSQGQNENEKMSTIFGGDEKHIDHGGWAGLNFGYTQINGRDTYLMGARGGWLINHRFTIGLAGSGLVSDQDYTDVIPDETLTLAGGYGGLFLEAVLWPFSPVHVTIPVTIGAGGIAYTSSYWRNTNYYDDMYTYDSDAYFLLEPGLEVELNLIKFMRLAVGGSYRYTSEINMVNSSPTMLRGFNGHFSLKFGWF